MAIPSFLYHSFARLFPRAAIETKSGTVRANSALEATRGDDGSTQYRNDSVCLTIREREGEEGSVYRLSLKNLLPKSLRITRLRFPAWRGLEDILEGFVPERVAFLRNGYQSWSTTRSYRMNEKPLRPRLRLVSMVSSNLANLPSNTPGMLSSEMYTILTELDEGQSVLVGQCPPFDQFVYIILNLHPKRERGSYFEVIYDFGRKVLAPGQEIELSGIYFTTGPAHLVSDRYFSHVAAACGYKRPAKNRLGWCSWYQYYERINPAIIRENLKAARESHLPFDFFQIDDGWQAATGDWLTEAPAFKGNMAKLSREISEAGMSPGLWLAPFSAAANSRLFKEHPEYLLRDEWGRAIRAGFNPTWKGFYYGLDVTHPRFREYLSEVILTITRDWGFRYLKLDFLFSACLRGANHHELGLSRAEILRDGMALIRAAAVKGTTLVGCGMPLSAGIGTVDGMRVGPDTGDFWVRLEGKLLRTGSMMGLRNSLRSTMMRAPMHGRLWVNDPDCILARATGTKLSAPERRSQLDALAVSGGLTTISDELSALGYGDIEDTRLLLSVNAECFGKPSVALDGMEREMPELFWNDALYLACFNWGPARKAKRYPARAILERQPEAVAFRDLRSGERFALKDGFLSVGPMEKRGSRLLRAELA